MKKLERYMPHDEAAQPWTMDPDARGAWVRYDDAMQALGDRQAIVDQCANERDRLLTCVEVADRMRALLADYYDETGDAEAAHISALYDDARRKAIKASADAAKT